MTVLALLCLVSLTSCSSENEIEQPKEMVTCNLSFHFAESGPMSRAASDIYSTFYENYIKNKVLTPKIYNLTFTNKETNATATMVGCWDEPHGIRLLEGEYYVTGTSYPKVVPSKDGEITCDTVYLKFEETVNITKDTKKITLNAGYDSYLLMFDKKEVSIISYSYTYTTGSSYTKTTYLKERGDIYPCFIPKERADAKVFIRRRDYKETHYDINVSLTNMPFEKGKYYYFNNVTNSFDIPPMQPGN